VVGVAVEVAVAAAVEVAVVVAVSVAVVVEVVRRSEMTPGALGDY